MGSVSRRNFLKIAAAAGAAGALPAFSAAEGKGLKSFDDDFPKVPEVKGKLIPGSAPHNCGGRCVTKAYVENVGDKAAIKRIITDERPDVFENPQLRACVRCRSYKTRLYHPGRLAYPMVQGYDEKGNRIKNFKRGDMSSFKRVSWEEAYNIIKKEYGNTVKKWGDEAVYWQWSSGAQGIINTKASMMRFGNLLGGGYLNNWGTYSYHQLFHIAPIVQGSPNTFAATPQEWLETDYMLLWGSHFATSINDTNVTYYYTCAREKAGFKSVFIGPEYTMTAELADEWVKIKPFTDAAMMLAMLYVMLDEGLFDKDVEKYAVGLFDDPQGNSYSDGASGKPCVVKGSEEFMKVPAGRSLSAYIFGEKEVYKRTFGGKTYANKAPSAYKSRPKSKFAYKRDMGVPKTPEWAEAITGVPADKIREIARDFAAADKGRKAYLHTSLGVQRQMEGVNNMWLMTALTAVAGQWGEPGRGWGKYFNYARSVPAGDMGKVLAGKPAKNKIPQYKTIPCSAWADAVRNGGTGKSEYGDGEVMKLAAPIKFIWNVGGNMMNQHMNSYKTAETLTDRDKGLYFHVVVDQFMTPTARYADVILPAAANWERVEMHVHASHMVYSSKAIDTPGEAKPDFQIAKELCGVFGLNDGLVTNGKTDRQFAKDLFESIKRPVTFEEFEKAGVLVNSSNNIKDYYLGVCSRIRGNAGVKAIEDKETEGAFMGAPTNARAVQFATRTGYLELYSAQGRMEYEYRYQIKKEKPGNRTTFINLKHPSPKDRIENYTHLNMDSEKDPKVYEIPIFFYPTDGYVDSKEVDIANIDKYPIICLSGKSMFRSHSTHNNTLFLRELYKKDKSGFPSEDSASYGANPVQKTFAKDSDSGLEPIWINVEDAAAFGISDGDKVKVTSAMTKKSLYASAFVTKRLMKGVSVIQEGSWFDPIKDKNGEVDQGGCANVLYSEIPSRMDNGNAQMNAYVRIEKA